MRTLLLGAVVFACVACPPKPPHIVVVPDAQIDAAPVPTADMAPPSPDLMPAPLPTCSVAAALKQEDVCEGFFTLDDLSCARCSNVKGCVDQTIVMYCATGPCADDPACRYIPDPTLKGARKAAAKKKR